LITTICRLYKPRDLRTILLAFSQLVHRADVRLLIVGDGPDRPRVEELAGRLGLESHIVFAGQRQDIPAILAATDIFTLTTWGWEGLPFTILEAMAAARPVVATRAGGIPEVLVEGKTGLLVPPRDPVALAGAWEVLAHSSALRAQMGTAGRQRVYQEFSREQMIKKTTQLYTDLVR
jgi:glycosyltransferase involved in cell wall biosynthesis